MGFFSELKSDLSQAVNTLMPEDTNEDAKALDAENSANKSSASSKKKEDLGSMLNRLDDLKLEETVVNTASEEIAAPVEEEEAEAVVIQPEVAKPEEEVVEEKQPEPVDYITANLDAGVQEEVQKVDEVKETLSAIEAIGKEHIEDTIAQETNIETESKNDGGFETMEFEQMSATDETAVITENMVISGDIQTTGSLDLVGKVTGNVTALGKLNITGEIDGDSKAAEIYAENARITGEVRSNGSAKVGQSTVIVGNIYATSAVIAGAVKGDIDVHGPVILDTTAIVMGNIRSQSVQINNGAVIEGMCSQSYAEVNPAEFFEGLKSSKNR
ncbi:MAG: polymer-forming cytoskeletal protein [Butyrivibrio sp.]|nr:polymer-forming cytoskeletal protein [Butyrivibrio sp.]